MGDNMSIIHNIPHWLDAKSRSLVADTVTFLRQHHPDLLAVILYGSIARHDERPIDDPHPSDIDLLAVFAIDPDSIRLPLKLSVSRSIVMAVGQHLDAPREVQVMIASQTLQEWDETFIANVARDGLVLYAKGQLPDPLRHLQPSLRASHHTSPTSRRSASATSG